jgi:hypothetical protein
MNIPKKYTGKKENNPKTVIVKSKGIRARKDLFIFIELLLLSLCLTVGCVQNNEKATTSCTDKCTFTGRSCSGNEIFTCVDGNGDGCKERNLIATCNSNEACSEGQCIKKAYCGDGICQQDESCSNCPKDCGDCTKVIIGPTKKYTSDQIEGCEEGSISIGGSTDRDLCYRYYAITDKKPPYCGQISDLTKRNDCYLYSATTEKNFPTCSYITTGSIRDSCYTEVAKSNSNAYICENIESTDGKDTCYSGVAIVSRNSNTCSKIISSKEKDSCYYFIAIQDNSVNICSPINDANLHDQCLMIIIRNLRLKDLSLCNQMTTNWKISCQSEMESGNYLS